MKVDIVRVMVSKRRAATCALLSLAVATGAWAGATSPTLVLATGRPVGAAPPYGVRLTGTFDFENVLQLEVPIELVVFQGSRFVRFPLGGDPLEGTTAAVADGILSQSDLPALDAASSPVGDGARVTALGPTAVGVALPSVFGPGPVTAIVVARLVEETVFSNPIQVVLP